MMPLEGPRANAPTSQKTPPNLSEKGYEHSAPTVNLRVYGGAKMRRKALSLVVHRATPLVPPTLFRQFPTHYGNKGKKEAGRSRPRNLSAGFSMLLGE